MNQCKGCGARIIWMETVDGKNIPVDYQVQIKDEKVFDHARMKAHFATCPEAGKFRKRDK